MRLPLLAASTLALATLAPAVSGQVTTYFSQNFNSSTTLADYISASSPTTSQFNAIGTSGSGTVISVASNNLSFARTGNAGSFSRTTDLSGPPTTLLFKFDLTVSGNSTSQTTAAVVQVGSAFDTTNNTSSNANTYARIAINLGSTAGQFQLRDVNTSTNTSTLSGTQTISWYLNNGSESVSYFGPDGIVTTLASEKIDLWVGTTRVFTAINPLTSTQTMSDFKFVFNAGTGTLTFDNITLTSIPEPAHVAAGFGALALAGVILVRRRRA